MQIPIIKWALQIMAINPLMSEATRAANVTCKWALKEEQIYRFHFMNRMLRKSKPRQSVDV